MASEKAAEKKLLQKLRAIQSGGSNRYCCDCNEMGPTFVCTSLWVFVCTNCSGIHRELNHKVKGVSLSKWTEAEVANIENKGNEVRARMSVRCTSGLLGERKHLPCLK
eukprot:GHVU01034473.1.p2 GENE.GHVU01034473.1~~GHVU01034473.1.p2  ORF type:complete len:108 (+),score=3.70 GHVU01034473.1:169-492(+)